MNPSKLLGTRLMILARVTGQLIVRLNLFSNGNCPLDWNSIFYANPLLKKNIQFDMKYLFEYLISEGSSKARVKSRERLYERYFLIQVTCNMNTKGQTWNENI